MNIDMPNRVLCGIFVQGVFFFSKCSYQMLSSRGMSKCAPRLSHDYYLQLTYAVAINAEANMVV
jgi:hypothetical protein